MNIFFKRARLQARLTQAGLARALGTTPVSIWRWEHGLIPSPFFRTAICAYFHLSPTELGWPSPEKPETVHEVQLPSLFDPVITEVSEPLISQHRFLSQVRDLLCAQDGPQRLGLTGLVGSGKTAIMQHLVTTPELQTAFAGILWASLGLRATRPLRHLQRWAHLLGLGTLPASLEEAQEVLRTVIGKRRILFVLDDVWTQADVVPFQVGGPACRYVLTTRQPGLAHVLCQQVLSVPDLTAHDAFALLLAAVPPAAVQEHTSVLHEVLQRIGNVPLAVILMREYLRREASLPVPRRFHAAVTRLANREAPSFFHLEMPWQSHSLYMSIQQSEERLFPSTQAVFRQLASHFQETAFSEHEAEALLSHQQLSSELDSLMDEGFLTWKQGFYHFHPMLVEYARLAASTDTNADPWLLSCASSHCECSFPQPS